MSFAQSRVTSDRRPRPRPDSHAPASHNPVTSEGRSIGRQPADADVGSRPTPAGGVLPPIGGALWRQIDRWMNEGGADARRALPRDDDSQQKTSAVSWHDPSSKILEVVRMRECSRIAATRANDVEALAPLLDDALVYIDSIGEICSKHQYLTAIATHRLTYDDDFDVQETDFRIFDGFAIFVGMMLGHSRIDREQQVLHGRSICTWREEAGEWRMVAWHSSSSYFGQF